MKEIAIRIEKDEKDKQRKTSKGIRQEIERQIDRVAEVTEKEEKEKEKDKVLKM